MQCVEKKSILCQEIGFPFRGCLYGIRFYPITTTTSSNTTTSGPTTTNYWSCYTYPCDYGDVYRRIPYSRYFELISDYCDGNCPSISLEANFSSFQELYEISNLIYAFFLSNFEGQYIPSVNDIAYNILKDTAFALPCSDRLECCPDNNFYIPWSTSQAPGVPSRGCCCGPTLTTSSPNRYWPNREAVCYGKHYSFFNGIPKGWVVVGDYYFNDKGLYCPTGCFIFPCVYTESGEIH